MDLHSIKTTCNAYINKKKGYSAEIDDYKEENGVITFEVRILKNGAFRATETLRIIRASELTLESQFLSKIERFLALVENNRY
ncbi:hypothetical protein ACFOTA_00965 [Chitinophaga sp. GCM10012297]|uniref:Uncharacterized protein n=1 Tax=Chitinophaga chungangae TaxID=2821488 RepID=A0ABS3Y7W1_9BACT|nr:hypothetical protein [Chitinophaga chungangae]MBO9150762.1 hypothetical protein [Chitinophaga chungangae]